MTKTNCEQCGAAGVTVRDEDSVGDCGPCALQFARDSWEDHKAECAWCTAATTKGHTDAMCDNGAYLFDHLANANDYNTAWAIQHAEDDS